MAKTKDEIYAELNRVKKLAGELRETAAGLKSVAEGDYQTGMDMIRANWSGDTAQKFMTRSEEVRTELNETAASLENAGSVLEKIAANYAEAELAALQQVSN